MAFGDFLDLKEAALRSAQGDPSDTGDLTRGGDAINRAYLRVCGNGFPHDFLEQEGQWLSTGGSDTYTYGSIATAMGITGASIREIIALTDDSTGDLLTSLSWEQLEDMTASTQESGEGTGTPCYWAKWGAGDTAEIRLYPNPDDAFTLGVFAYLKPAAMTADADEPLIPDSYRHSVLVSLAAAILLGEEGGAEAAADRDRHQADHREAVRDMHMAHSTAKRPTFNVVAPTAFDHLPGSGESWAPW